MSHIQILNGSPGAGKTTKLMDLIEDAMAHSVKPEKIGFVSFTRKALRVARNRATERFNLTRAQFPYFKTLHAMAYTLLARPGLLSGTAIKTFAHRTGIQLDGHPMDMSFIDLKPEDLNSDALYFERGRKKDDATIALINYARNKFPGDPESIWKAYNSKRSHRRWDQTRRIAETYAQFKANLFVNDHTDLLEKYVNTATAVIPILDLLCIDEAQDLSNLQWRVAQKLMTRAKRVVIVGDADQAIFEWAGAAPETFVQYTHSESTTLLGQSYRVPRRVQGLANLVAKQMYDRDPKAWKPTDEAGVLRFIPTMYEAPLRDGSWLVLARNNFTLDKVVRPWLEAHFVTEKDWAKRIDVRTIHRAKGGEADNVLLFPELSNKEWVNHDSNSELRTLYVALTRARQGLYVVEPRQWERRYHLRDLLLNVTDEDLLNGSGKVAA